MNAVQWKFNDDVNVSMPILSIMVATYDDDTNKMLLVSKTER